MPGDVGLVAKAVNTIVSWLISEDGLNELRKRRALQAKKEEARRAIKTGDWAAAHERIRELQRLSEQP